MLNGFSGADKVYIACGYTDLRKGIDGLARTVRQQFALEPFTNTLFLFCGRRRDRIKGLYWEGDGFILLCKRLEQGAYQWPRSEAEVRSLTPRPASPPGGQEGSQRERSVGFVSWLLRFVPLYIPQKGGGTLFAVWQSEIELG